MKPTLKDKALAVIEDLVSSDFILGLEYKIFKKKSSKNKKKYNNIITQVYKAAHAVNAKESGACYHPDWEQEIEELYKKL